ncbi:COG1470 family protein [[Eubacterium] cellulosolvens]
MRNKTVITISTVILVLLLCFPISVEVRASDQPCSNSRGDIELRADNIKQNIAPNLHDPKAEAVYNIMVINRGNDTDQFTTTEVSDHGFVVIINPTTTNNLGSQQSTTVTITIQVDNNAPMTNFDYNTTVTVTSRTNNSKFETITLKTRILQAYGVELQPTHTTAETGNDIENNHRIVSFPMHIQNIGTGTDNFKLEVTGDYSSWANLNSSYFKLGSQEKTSAMLTLNVPRETVEGDYKVGVKAISRGDDDQYDSNDTYHEIVLTVQVTQLFELLLDSDQTQKAALPGTVVWFNVTIINRGNGDDYVDLRKSDYDLDWDWWLSDNYFKLSPMDDHLGGDIRTITLSATVPTDEHGMNGNYNISIFAYSSETPSGKIPQNNGEPLVFTVRVGKVYGVDLILVSPTSSEEQRIDPGKNLTYELTLVNKGNTVDSIKLRALGEKSGWVEFTKNEFDLQPYEALDFNITLKIPDSTAVDPAEIEAKKYGITIKATSDNDVYADDEVELTPIIEGIYDVEFEASEIDLDSTDSGNIQVDPNTEPSYSVFTLIVTNKGNTLDKLQLMAAEKGDWEVKFKTPSVSAPIVTISLAISRSETVTVQVYPPSDAENGDMKFIKIQAKSENGKVTETFTLRANVHTAEIIFKSFTISDTTSGSTATIKLTVANYGDVPAEDVEIKFYDMSSLIHSERLDKIDGHDEVEVSFTYELEDGQHDLQAETQWSDRVIKKNEAFVAEYDGDSVTMFFIAIIIIVIIIMMVLGFMFAAATKRKQPRYLEKEPQEARQKGPEESALELEAHYDGRPPPPEKLKPI